MARKKKILNSPILYLAILVVTAIVSALGIEVGGLSQTVNTVNIENLEHITIKTGENINNQFISTNSENLQVYFFDVGQADSILIKNKNQTMLIDAGNNEAGDLLVHNLNELNVTTIDYLIGTHPHEDHIGGLDNIIKNFNIKNFYIPKVQTNTKTFEDVLDAAQEKNILITTPKVNDTFMVGNANCKILAVGNNKENLNLCSIVVQMNFEGTTYLFTGDAEKEVETAMQVGKINVLKVGHHGSDTSSSEEFLKKTAPELAIISVGKNNSYGHPNQITLDNLNKIGSKIYRTDEVGNIMLEQEKEKDI